MSLARPVAGSLPEAAARCAPRPTRIVQFGASFARSGESDRVPAAPHPAGISTFSRRASRDMRAQCRSHANSAPSTTRSVLKTPQPDSRPSWPANRLARMLPESCRYAGCSGGSTYVRCVRHFSYFIISSRFALNSVPGFHCGYRLSCATLYPISKKTRRSSTAPERSQSGFTSSDGLW